MSTCNRLDLQTLGSQPVMLKNLPEHCVACIISCFPLFGDKLCPIYHLFAIMVAWWRFGSGLNRFLLVASRDMLVPLILEGSLSKFA